MKKERLIEILIIFILISLAIAGILTFRYYKFIKPNTYDIVFKDIDSIVKGSPVRFMGINTGHVIDLKRKDDYIICKIRITKKDVKIPNMTRAKVEYNGLGGSKSIELLPPLANSVDKETGIIALESLRITDIGGILKSLTDVCTVINNFVQAFDETEAITFLKTITNPKNVDKLNESLDKIEVSNSKKEPEKNKFKMIDDFNLFIKNLKERFIN